MQWGNSLAEQIRLAKQNCKIKKYLFESNAPEISIDALRKIARNTCELMSNLMRKKGKIKTWNSEKAYGFIVPLADGPDIFVHKNAFANRERLPKAGDWVTYTVAQDPQGRACAVDAIYAGEKRAEKPKQTRGDLTIGGIIAFGVIAAASAMLGKTPFWLPVVYLGMSCLTFLFYWQDKSAAQKDRWRTPESTLHMLALAGGWPGAALAQQKLRHKSKKQEFRFVYWMTVLLNVGFFVWLHTDSGAAFQSSILGI